MRHWARFTDQHGRTWGANTDEKTGHPCSGLEPQFDAPLRVPDIYIKVKAGEVVIGYQAWLRDKSAVDTPTELIYAALQDNKWVLGFTKAIPQWALKYVAAEIAESYVAPYEDKPEPKPEQQARVRTSPRSWREQQCQSVQKAS